MSKPFFRSSTVINTIAFIVALVAVIIFISSCLLNVYAYAIHPTATPTATITPTTTNTLRPTNTPTPTSTETPEPTATLTPTIPVPTGPEGYSELEAAFADRGYDCLLNQADTAAYDISCRRVSGDFSYSAEFQVDTEANFTAVVRLEPFILERSVEFEEELVWLASVPRGFPWMYGQPAVSTSTATPSPTSSTVEPDPLGAWIRSNLPLLSSTTAVEQQIDELFYSMQLEGQTLLLHIEVAAPAG